MNESQQREKLLLRILHLISAKFKNQAVLKGGLSLRLFNSPRFTQDVDLVFITSISRKIIAKEIEDLLKKENDITLTNTTLNSRGVFIDVDNNGIIAQIEISVTDKLNCEPETMTTASMAIPLNLPPQIILIMSRPESFSNKIAAALERTTSRDLYDISLYEPMTDFDITTLQQRLNKLYKGKNKYETISFQDAASRLKKRVLNLHEQDLIRELTGLVPEAYLQHSPGIIKSSVNRLCQKLEQLK